MKYLLSKSNDYSDTCDKILQAFSHAFTVTEQFNSTTNFSKTYSIQLATNAYVLFRFYTYPTTGSGLNGGIDLCFSSNLDLTTDISNTYVGLIGDYISGTIKKIYLAIGSEDYPLEFSTQVAASASTNSISIRAGGQAISIGHDYVLDAVSVDSPDFNNSPEPDYYVANANGVGQNGKLMGFGTDRPWLIVGDDVQAWDNTGCFTFYKTTDGETTVNSLGTKTNILFNTVPKAFSNLFPVAIPKINNGQIIGTITKIMIAHCFNAGLSLNSDFYIGTDKFTVFPCFIQKED
jgi:hypothetical protein